MTFLCNVESKALFRKKEKKSKVVSELSGHPIRMLNTDSSNSLRRKTVSGARAQLAYRRVDTHLLWLQGEEFRLRHPHLGRLLFTCSRKLS